MKRVISLILSLSLSLSLFTGCGKSTSSTAPSTAPAASKIKVSLVTDISGINDQSFNQSSWDGMKRSQDKLGLKISYKESNQNADYIPNLQAMYDEKNDLIWGVGFMMNDAILEAAKNNPDQKFAIIDVGGWDKTPSNLLGVLFRAQDSGFLVGYIAGKMTKTNKVGFIGGMSIPPLWQFECGYRAGVKYANPKADIVIQYAESFTDVAKGKSIANGMFVQNVDIIFQAAGGLGNGVIEAAKENKKWAIGVDRDQNYLAPDNVLTSAMKRVDNAVYNVNKDLAEGKFKGGSTVVYGLKEGAVGIAPTSSKNVPKEVLDQELAIEKKIESKEIVAPGTYEELDAFMAKLGK